jgi:hypothetical protein
MKAIYIKRGKQLAAWASLHLQQCAEAHRFLDELGIPWHERRRIFTLKERIEMLCEQSRGGE